MRRVFGNVEGEVRCSASCAADRAAAIERLGLRAAACGGDLNGRVSHPGGLQWFAPQDIVARDGLATDAPGRL